MSETLRILGSEIAVRKTPSHKNKKEFTFVKKTKTRPNCYQKRPTKKKKRKSICFSRNASIHSVGGPSNMLNKEWIRMDIPLNRVVYTCDDMVLSNEDGLWTITSSTCVLARALSSAQHPVTVYSGEWFDADENVIHGFEFVLKDFGSHQNPLHFDDFGIDYFVRKQTNSVIWYLDHDGLKVHSGAKGNQCDPRPGVRYCHICHRYFSETIFGLSIFKTCTNVPDTRLLSKTLKRLLFLQVLSKKHAVFHSRRVRGLAVGSCHTNSHGRYDTSREFYEFQNPCSSHVFKQISKFLVVIG